jgi:hypothetical protein
MPSGPYPLRGAVIHQPLNDQLLVAEAMAKETSTNRYV